MELQFCEHSGVKLDLKLEDIQNKSMIIEVGECSIPTFVTRTFKGRNEKYSIKTNFISGLLEMSLVSK